jgi:hypothetical protein
MIGKSRSPHDNICWRLQFNKIRLDWINKHTISLWLYNSPRRSRHIATCRASPSVPFKQRSAKMSISQVQRMFTVRHCLASRSYLTGQNVCSDRHYDSPAPNKSKISRIVNGFCEPGSVQDKLSGRPTVLNDYRLTWEKVWMHASLKAADTCGICKKIRSMFTLRSGLRSRFAVWQ